jgi:transposase
MTKEYPSNLTWEQWELIRELFPEAKPGGRPRTVAIYADDLDGRGISWGRLYALGNGYVLLGG